MSIFKWIQLKSIKHIESKVDYFIKYESWFFNQKRQDDTEKSVYEILKIY